MGVYEYDSTNDKLNPIAGATTYAENPIGSIIPFGGETSPVGWLFCRGQELLRADYAELFEVIGTSFGVGDGSTTFNLPDLREAVPKGAGLTGYTVGAHLDADGLAVGEFIDDRIQNIVIKSAEYGSGYWVDDFVVRGSGGGTLQYQNISHRIASQGSNRFGATTEVKSVGVNYIIKAKMVALPADFEAQIDADYQKKDLTTPLTIDGASQTTVEDALGALNSAKVDSATLGRFKTITVTLSPSTQRTISFSNIAKRVRIDIDSTGANNNTQFHGVLVGYNEMTSNRLIGLYKRGTNGLLASMDSYELTLANPSVTATDTVILTFYNFSGNITTTISDESAITLTEMGVGWQEIQTTDTYSTTETKTNKVWIDGKPIYRTVFSGSANAGTTTVGTLSNVDVLMDIQQVFYSSSASQSHYFAGSSDHYRVLVTDNNANVKIDCSGDINYHVVLEYTKTTD